MRLTQDKVESKLRTNSHSARSLALSFGLDWRLVKDRNRIRGILKRMMVKGKVLRYQAHPKDAFTWILS